MTSGPHLIYVSNNRLPTERAHGLQIVQNCEALANAGYTVTLVGPRRHLSPEARNVPIWDYYGVAKNFTFVRVWCLDLLHWLPRAQAAFLLQTLTYLVALAIWLLRRPADVIFTRDVFVAAMGAALRPRVQLAYEVHQINRTRLGCALQSFVVRRAAVIALTRHLADQLEERGASPQRMIVAHDGIRGGRFDSLPEIEAARAAVGWPVEAFIVGWVGRLATLGMDKGVGTLVDAMANVDGATLAVIGGPGEAVEQLRQRWTAAGLPSERFITPGQVAPADVPRYLAACDVCAMPFPWTEHFAYYASPIKLFEYMAAGRAVVASDLPSTAEVVTHEESALLVPPGDVDALRAAIVRLRDDPALRERLGHRAREIALATYTWDARAHSIRQVLENA